MRSEGVCVARLFCLLALLLCAAFPLSATAQRADDPRLEEARRLSDESRELRQKGKYDEALPLAERALQMREQVLGPDDTAVADSLHALAVIYDNKAEYAKAEPINVRALAIREKALGVDHPDVAKTLNNLAWIYGVRHDFEKAAAFYQRALAIQEKALGPDHADVATTLNDLALLYLEKGDYAQSIAVNERVLAIREARLGPDDSSVAKALNNLALVYTKTGDYTKAEDIYRRSLSIWEKALGPVHPDVAFAIDNLARVYYYVGDYAKAEPLFQRALTIRENAVGPDHPATVTSLNNLANVYRIKGDYAKAEPLLQRVLSAWEKRFGRDHPGLAPVTSNLARLYEDTGDYAKAEPLHQRALAIREKALGPNHVDVGESLNNLGQLYLTSNKNAAQIEPLLRRSLEIMQNALGPDRPNVAVPLSNLAAVYEAAGDGVRAEEFHLRALAIREKGLGPNHPNVAQSLDNLARLYEKRGDAQNALEFLSRYNTVREHNLDQNLDLGSERQKLGYLKLFAEDTNHALSLHARLAPRNQQALDLAFTTLLRRKARALDAMGSVVAALLARSSPHDRALFGELFEARSRLAAIALRGPDERTAPTYVSQITRLEEEVDRLEAQVSARSAEFRAHTQPITLDAVRALIPDATTLIEFARYEVDEARTGRREPPHYAAYVLTHDGPARWVDLGEADPIDRAVASWRRALRDPQRTDAKRLGRALDARVMQPVRAVVGPARHLLISGDGSLNVIPFAALVDEQNGYLIERFSITYVTSGRDLLRLQVPRASRTSAVVVADPAFGEPASLAPRGAARQVDYSQIFFGPLPGVAEEVRALRQLLPDASFFTKERATKTALKQISGPSILHVATHGFFLDDLASAPAAATGIAGATLKPPAGARVAKWAAWTDNPLLRSGLALAGANQSRGDEDEGVLTALETTGLDLWGTKLVVLSACETGLGDVKNGEGVYGLRRALVLAGAESQVMSLWAVSDRGTSDLMAGYYKALLDGQGRGEALRQVQLRMLRTKARSHPYYWASFIESGEWANLQGQR